MMKLHAWCCVLMFALALAVGGNARAQSNEELKRQLDQALKAVDDLQKRVKSLEGQKSGGAAAANKPETSAAPAASSPAGAPVVAPDSVAEEGAPNADKARVEVSGMVQLDAIYDFNRVDPDWNATLRPSKIPVVCPGDPGCGKDGESIMSIRQTKLGFKGYLPTRLGLLSTWLDFDLFDSGGGNTRARVLNAWGELGMFGAGQTYTLFMNIDTFPNTLDYWGPSGMVFIRNPQLRVTPYNSDGMKVAFSLEQPGAAIDTGKVADVDPALAAGVTGRTRFPDLIGQFRLDRGWGHFQAAGMLRQIGFETPANPGANPSGTKSGYGLSLNGQYNTIGQDRVVAHLVLGRGIASYMNDGGVDLAPSASLSAEAVQSVGWFVYYDHYWTNQWSSSVGLSEHRQSNTDGQLANAFKKGTYSSVNLLYMPVKNMTVGGELLWGKRENKDGQSGDDTRVQFSARYKF
jgi:hypothetical protein